MSPGTRSGFLAQKSRSVRTRRALEYPDDSALEALRRAAVELQPAPPLAAALREGPTVALIAEFKRRSPTAGDLAAAESAAVVARSYADEGATALSVLTDAADFGGTLADLRLAAGTGLPVLRKDFIVDDAMVFEARAAGAAAALLIGAMLSRRELEHLLEAARACGLECLVEVHDESEAEQALDAGARLLGINNRDLASLSTDLATTGRLARCLPADATLVSESGIRSREDVERVRDAGAHAVLVGEALLRLPPPRRAALVRELAGVPR
jgi:indole-3-glycerol phosphate synthase